MNYYKKHIGDYVRDTAHLSMIEDGAYNRMIDLCYSREAPLPADRGELYRLSRAVTSQERKAVDSVLNEFYRLHSDGWHQKRCDQEIAHALEKTKANRVNGLRGGRPKKEPNYIPPDNPTETQVVSESNQNRNPNETLARAGPLATSHYSVPNGTGVDPPPSVSEPDPIFGHGLAFLKAKGCAERGARSFLGLMRKQHGDVAVVEVMERAEREDVSDPIPWIRKGLEGGHRPRRVAI